MFDKWHTTRPTETLSKQFVPPFYRYAVELATLDRQAPTCHLLIDCYLCVKWLNNETEARGTVARDTPELID
eukprot:1621428-Amphidinium_carterae.1